VDLHQVDHVGAQQLDGAPHLTDPGIPAGRPHLGREKTPVTGTQVGQQIAGDRLGSAVHRRRIDYPPAGIEQ
jgi:hypothetical protein